MDVNNIFSLSSDQADFTAQCLDTFHFQYANNPVYKAWCELLGIDTTAIKT